MESMSYKTGLHQTCADSILEWIMLKRFHLSCIGFHLVIVARIHTRDTIKAEFKVLGEFCSQIGID